MAKNTSLTETAKRIQGAKIVSAFEDSKIGDVYIPYEKFNGSFIPNWLMERTDLTPAEKIVWAKLAQYSGKDGICYPKQKRLASDTGLCESKINRAIKKLSGEDSTLKYPLIIKLKPEGMGRLQHLNCSYKFIVDKVLLDCIQAEKPVSELYKSQSGDGTGASSNIRGKYLRDQTGKRLKSKAEVSQPSGHEMVPASKRTFNPADGRKEPEENDQGLATFQTDLKRLDEKDLEELKKKPEKYKDVLRKFEICANSLLMPRGIHLVVHYLFRRVTGESYRDWEKFKKKKYCPTIPLLFAPCGIEEIGLEQLKKHKGECIFNLMVDEANKIAGRPVDGSLLPYLLPLKLIPAEAFEKAQTRPFVRRFHQGTDQWLRALHGCFNLELDKMEELGQELLQAMGKKGSWLAYFLAATLKGDYKRVWSSAPKFKTGILLKSNPTHGLYFNAVAKTMNQQLGVLRGEPQQKPMALADNAVLSKDELEANKLPETEPHKRLAVQEPDENSDVVKETDKTSDQKKVALQQDRFSQRIEQGRIFLAEQHRQEAERKRQIREQIPHWNPLEIKSDLGRCK